MILRSKKHRKTRGAAALNQKHAPSAAYERCVRLVGDDFRPRFPMGSLWFDLNENGERVPTYYPEVAE